MSDGHKSAELVKIAEEHGWKTQVTTVIPEDFDDNPMLDRIEWHFYGLRGTETIHVLYRGDRMTEENLYTFGSYTRYPQRRVAVVGLLTGEPDLSKNKEAAPELLLENKRVDFASDTPAMDIMLKVLGRRVQWVRKLDGMVCEAHIPKESNLGSKYFRVYDHHSNGRYLEFLNYEGFHTVALDQIVSVG